MAELEKGVEKSVVIVPQWDQQTLTLCIELNFCQLRKKLEKNLTKFIKMIIEDVIKCSSEFAKLINFANII